MAKTKEARAQWKKLDFLCDEDGSCALTVFLDGTRLHVIADADKFDRETIIGKEYHRLVRLYQHSDSDYNGSNKENESRADSGVDVENSNSETNPEEQDPADLEEQLRQWMMSPVLKVFKPASSEKTSSDALTIQEWYHCPTRFYNLDPTPSGKGIKAVELEPDSDLEERMSNLLPQATLPKYITNESNITCYNASDLSVLAATDQPTGTPYHPCRVQHIDSKKVHFLKVVDNIQPQAAKREIHLLHRLRKLKLDEEFNVPSLDGLVAFDDTPDTDGGKKTVMGFLLTDIADPTPLTEMLRKDVPQSKRDNWAKEVQRIKDLLHDNDIIWGDAKADNFMVDAEERLWIIDFGGGYTEGWIEPQLIETEEGDNLGTKKIVNALQDPEKNVVREDEEVVEEEKISRKSSKRKRDGSEVEDDRAAKVKRS